MQEISFESEKVAFLQKLKTNQSWSQRKIPYLRLFPEASFDDIQVLKFPLDTFDITVEKIP